MNKFEEWFLKRVFAKEVRQGYDHDTRIRNLYRMVNEAARKEFNEDNDPTLYSFLLEQFEQTLPTHSKNHQYEDPVHNLPIGCEVKWDGSRFVVVPKCKSTPLSEEDARRWLRHFHKGI